MLEEQRIGPELRLQDFDKYMDLMNGRDADNIIKFMHTNPPFQEYCNLIGHYKMIENEIAQNVWGVVSMGLYEFHRESLIRTLEILARFMQTELLERMVADQQTDMAQLQAEYEDISATALTIPNDTAELMASKAYVSTTDNITIPKMEDRLRIVSIYLKKLKDYYCLYRFYFFCLEFGTHFMAYGLYTLFTIGN